MRFSPSLFGILACAIFAMALLLFGFLNPEFDFVEDYVSRLGASGEPYALGWNLIGFVLVGVLLTAFGISYGRRISDTIAGGLLAAFGVGFALTAIPIDPENATAALSKAHVVMICLALAAWLFGLAKISANKGLPKAIRLGANIAAILLITAMLGFVLGFWSMPITHRLVFLVVFGWTAFSSVKQRKEEDRKS